MRFWRTAALVAGVGVVGVVLLAALLEFLTPALSYRLRDRVGELTSDRRGRPFRLAVGAASGSGNRVGVTLNRYLQLRSGYQLDLVVGAAPGHVAALLDTDQRVDFAIISGADEEAVRTDGVYGVAALASQHFFVIVPNDSVVEEFRDLAGPVNPGAREPGQPPTLGERVLDYYGLLSPPRGAPQLAPRVRIVRPREDNVRDFESDHMVAATRTQFLHADLVEDILGSGGYRLVPIRDHEALALAIPGTAAGFIPSGLYGPGRRIPLEPVPTLTVSQLLVARGDVPGRVVSDVLAAIYDPRFGRDLQYEVNESSGSRLDGLPLHEAASLFYGRNALPTSDRLGRVTFVASAMAGLFAAVGFVARMRRRDSLARRRRLLDIEIAKLEDIRARILEQPDPGIVGGLLRESDTVLWQAERDAAVDRLDASAIASLRSLHGLCRRAAHDVGQPPQREPSSKPPSTPDDPGDIYPA